MDCRVSTLWGPYVRTALLTAWLSTASEAHADPSSSAAGAPPTSASVPSAGEKSDAVPSLTLDAALAFARAHQPSLRLARSRIAAAEAQADVPRGQWLPRLGGVVELFAATANNSTSSYVSSYLVDIPRIGGTSAITSDKVGAASLKPYASSFVGVGLDQEIFDFGRIAAQTAAFDAQTDAERFRAASDELDVDLAVREAFFAVSGAKSIVKAADAAFDRAKSQRDLTKAGLDNGLRTPVDLARSDADLAKYEVGRARARGSLDLARGLLATVIAYPAPVVDAADDLPTGATSESLERALADAERRDPALAAARARVRAQEAATSAIGAEQRPNLYLSSSISVRGGGAPLANGDTSVGRGFLPVIPNWDAGVVLSVPMFDGVTDARRRASAAKEKVLRDEAELVRERGSDEVERAYFASQTAEATIPALERARDAALASYQATEARFQQGLGTSVELLDAQSLLTESEIQLVLGRFDLARQRARLRRAIAAP